jgi:ankyrin repeat protein
MEAAEDGSASALNLLRARVHVNCADAANQTALHLTVRRGKLEATALLLGAGADPNLQDVDGTTPLGGLHHFLDDDPEAMVAMLLKRGADPRIADATGRTPLHRAYREPAVTRLLLEAGAGAGAVDAEGMTALHWCARWVVGDEDADIRVEVAEALLAADTSLAALRDHEGNMALDLLEEEDDRTSPEAVERLVSILTPSG